MIQEAIPSPVRDVFFDARSQWVPSPYKVLHGGRGGLKTWTFGAVCTLLAARRRIRILCTREYQANIDDSVHAVIVGQIERFGLQRYFDVQNRWIGSHTGSEFIFAGLRKEPKKIKGLERIGIAWLEEAENTSRESLEILTPTVFRNPGAEIFVSFNPDKSTDPVSQWFIEKPIPGARIRKTSWRDNPWLPPQMLAEKDYLASVDPDAYQHVWEGGYREHSDAQILKGKYVIESFTPGPDWHGPLQGADWGFAKDPTVFTRCWIHQNKLYVEHEAYGIGVDTRDLPKLYGQIPDFAKYTTFGDNARPETISDLQKYGLPRIRPCEKWSGSVEDGIAHLRSYEQIVIHPRCVHTAQEAKLYSYKVDKVTKLVQPEVVDLHNHCWDAIRYGLQTVIRRVGMGLFDFMRQQAAEKANAQNTKP